jgi:hypothetical protein
MRTRFVVTAALAFVGMIGIVANAAADTIDVLVTADGDVVIVGGNPVGGVSNGPVNVSQNVIANQETRSVYEFDLPLLTSPLVSATFLGSAVQNSAPPGLLSFFGFSGNGTVETTDATQTSNLVGSTTITAQLGSGLLVPIEVPLSLSFVQGLGSGFLGLTTTVGTADTVGIASLETNNPAFLNNPQFIRPTLRLVTADGGTPPVSVPEPGTMLLVGSGFVALVARARKQLQGHMA